MSFRFPFKSKSLLIWITGLSTLLAISVFLGWSLIGDVWTQADFQIVDMMYRSAAKRGYTAEADPDILYLAITDDTYQTVGRNTLNRQYLANLNDILADAGARAAAYDLLFAYPSNPEEDRHFAESIARAGIIYLPVGFGCSDQPQPFRWEDRPAYTRLRQHDLAPLVERGSGQPCYATRALPQFDDFASAAYGSGHMNAAPDPDGVYRHHPLLVKIDNAYIPTFALAMFLDDLQASFDQVSVNWGQELRIPESASRYLDHDIVIPIDRQGRVFLSFTQPWREDFAYATVHDVVQLYADVATQGNVENLLSGRFVLMSDVAQGISDLGQTPLDKNAPLIVLHATLLNALLTETFYRQWSFRQVMAFLGAMALLLMLAGLPKPLWPLYLTGSMILVSIPVFAWIEFTRFVLFPVVSTTGSVLIVFIGLVIGLQVGQAREQAFIRNAFAHYLPESVVKHLLNTPESLRLGGEKRRVTAVFSDLYGFTSFSEFLSPEELVGLLNEYLTEMTTIILNEGGIIDKYEGDALMAEFGVPLPMDDQAERAVAAALKMQRRLEELRPQWIAQGLPELRCRIGINTGDAIIGNMGSQQVFDYTAIGDDVNLASRLEGANKLYQSAIMISEATYNLLTPGRFRTRILDIIRVKGKSQVVKVFEVYGRVDESFDDDTLAYYQAYQHAFESYMAHDFSRAQELFAAAINLRPNDPASTWLIERIAALNPDELPDDWDGSIALTSK